MITLFTIPKPFIADDAMRQHNAIKSWQAAFDGQVEIVLYGDDAGVSETAQNMGVAHISGIACNEYGTPLLNWAFRDVSERASTPYIGYINADILIMGNFASALNNIDLKQFLMVGRRYDANVERELVPWDSMYEEICHDLIRSGELRGHGAVDYFCFTRGLFSDIPPFAVGRPRWDNWMIGHAIEKQIPIVDVTNVAPIIHQNHDYKHVKNSRGGYWNGPEGDANREIAESSSSGIGLILDASHILNEEGLSLNFSDDFLWRRIKRLRKRIDKMDSKPMKNLIFLYLAVLIYKFRLAMAAKIRYKLIFYLCR